MNLRPMVQGTPPGRPAKPPVRPDRGRGPLSRRCAGFKRDGTRCSATVTGPSDKCWHHDEAHAAERKRLASRAGRGSGRGSGRGGPAGSGSGEIAGLKAQLQEIADGVLDGSVLQGRGRSACRP